jgi:hypothetical protein
MWWIMIAIFVKKDFNYQITNLKTESVAVGMANIMGNKGAVMITFRIFETSFTFINCHFAA